MEKSTTVSVGKIASSIDNDTMRTLLEACGRLKSWKRAEDPETKALKGFGFAEYQDAEGVLRAIRLLHGMKVDGQELVIKGNSATQRYVERYEANKAAEREKAAQARLDAIKKRQEEGEVVDEAGLEQEAKDDATSLEQAADNKALEVIMGVVSEREADAARRGGPGLPPPPPPPGSAAELIQQVASRVELKGERGSTPHDDRGRHDDRDRERDRDREERDREREERDKEREERDRRREVEREYESRLRDWERTERQRRETREREAARMEQAERDRLRQCRADVEVWDEEDDGVPPWARRPYRGSRRCMERRRRRLQEEEADALDKQREHKELEQVAERKRRHASVDEEDGLSGVPGGTAVSSHKQPKAGAPPGQAAVSEASTNPRQSPEVDEADPIYQAMKAAAAHAPPGAGAKAAGPTRPGDRLLHHATHDPHAAIKSGHRSAMRSESPPPSATSAAPPPVPATKPPLATAAAAPRAGSATSAPAAGGGKRSALVSMFGEDEEDGSKRRVLKPIKYSEEEMKVVEEMEQEKRDAALAEQQKQQAAAAVDQKAALRALMDSIPTTKEAVWAYQVKWAQLTEAVNERLSRWVDSKIAQLLGAPEPSVVAFILELIAQSKGAAEAASELEPLLDSDTETFVLKLYRTVIFETERGAAGYA